MNPRGRNRTMLAWGALALAGLLIAVGVSYAASRLASPNVGLSSEPIGAGAKLAPAKTTADRPPKAKAKPKSKRPKKKRPPATTTTPPVQPPPPTTSTPSTPPRPPVTPTTDDHGGGSDDSSGHGSGGEGQDD